jgi:DNA invertase Pin-like site-specific DNA recombinase
LRYITAKIEHLDEGFVSFTEALDLTTSAGRAMSTLMSVFAEFEREIMQERVRAGLAHSRRRGERLGRPTTSGMHTNEVRKLRNSGLSKSEISRRLNIGRTSVRQIFAVQTNR